MATQSLPGPRQMHLFVWGDLYPAFLQGDFRKGKLK